MREYKTELTPPIIGDLFTIEEWNKLKNNLFRSYDGNGYWVKKIDNEYYESDDEVFSTSQEDATHVIWFNK